VAVALGKHLRDQLARLDWSSFRLDEWQIEALEEHLEMLRKWNRRMNLTGITDLDEIVRRHYGESLLLGSLLPGGGLSVADVGSGAGFPGYPIAVLRREFRVALIESNSRKAVFLRQSCRNAENVRVVEGRAEECQQDFDWLVARGVAWRDLARLVPGLGRSVGVLVGEKGISELEGDRRIRWQEPVPIPWMRSSVAMLGSFRSGERST